MKIQFPAAINSIMWKPNVRYPLASVAVALCVIATAGAAEFETWSRIELRFDGPESKGRGEPNPFAIRFDVDFVAPDGKRQLRVPGFYDGDGEGGIDGRVWKVRFSADAEGEWTYRTSSPEDLLDGATGIITVTPVSNDARGFWKSGRLEFTGTPENGVRYLKFRDGPYWLKAGCDDPENFLGNYRNFDTLAKRIAAVDYLAGRGINSLYMMTHNIGGDDKDVWPWLGDSADQARANGGRDARFDVARLEQWRVLFEHMQSVGVVPYLVLEDDSAWKGYDHVRYYREIVARFSYLPALVFNLGEEHNENYRLADALALVEQLKKIDPYGTPCGIHNVNQPDDRYIDSPQVDLTSIQTGNPGSHKGLKFALEHNRLAVGWIARCRSRGRRVLVVNFDEGRPELDRRAWWSAYLGGGVWEAHVPGPYDQPLPTWEKTWNELGGARSFMESLPFHAMQPRNDLVLSGAAFCLATDDGAATAFYLPEGGSVELELADAAKGYDADWWNPANGFDGRFQNHEKIEMGARRRKFTAPGTGDWALRVLRRQ